MKGRPDVPDRPCCYIGEVVPPAPEVPVSGVVPGVVVPGVPASGVVPVPEGSVVPVPVPVGSVVPGLVVSVPVVSTIALSELD